MALIRPRVIRDGYYRNAVKAFSTVSIKVTGSMLAWRTMLPQLCLLLFSFSLIRILNLNCLLSRCQRVLCFADLRRMLIFIQQPVSRLVEASRRFSSPDESSETGWCLRRALKMQSPLHQRHASPASSPMHHAVAPMARSGRPSPKQTCLGRSILPQITALHLSPHR